MVHFYIHTQMNEMDEGNIATMSGDIYNMMISQDMIEKNDKVIVFNILPNLNKLLIIGVDHVSFGHIKYEKGSLGNILIRMMNVDRTKDKALFVAEATIVNGKATQYALFEIPIGASTEELLQSFHRFKKMGMTSKEIEDSMTYMEYMSTKPLEK
jgi:hypothetical protein